MSFKCHFCKQTTTPGEAAVMIVLETRDKVYEERRREKKIIDRGGAGFETVREAKSCKECASGRE